MSYLTRALLRLELGEERGALADAARLQAVSEESARFVRDYARLLLPEWGFAPARDRPDTQGRWKGFPTSRSSRSRPSATRCRSTPPASRCCARR
jgi:hypothetical protein